MRLDSGVVDGSAVSVHYDPMLAKVISFAPTRGQAASLLADALARARVHGVGTNRDLLVNVLGTPRSWPARPKRRSSTPTAGGTGGTAGRPGSSALVCDRRGARRRGAQSYERNRFHRRTVGVAQPGVGRPGQDVHRHDGRRAPSGVPVRPDGLHLRGDESLTLVSATAGHVVLTVDDVDRPFSVARYGDSVYVDSPLGPGNSPSFPASRIRAPPSTPAPAAPMPGAVSRSVRRSATPSPPGSPSCGWKR